ncbi:MAG: hypothetical protein EXR27_06470 [Betaproteobacteria bacterium]|nr:hypothetical protein [Betaproteobacteria bacterium]
MMRSTRTPVALLMSGLLDNILAGIRLALFLSVRTVDFRVSAGQYAGLLVISLACWLIGGIIRGGWPGFVNLNALMIALAQVPLVLGICCLVAWLFRRPPLLVAFAVLFTCTDPLFELVGIAVNLLSGFEAMALYAAAMNVAYMAWAFAIIVRTQILLTGWRGRRSLAAIAGFAAMFVFFVWFFPRTELWTPLSQATEGAGRERPALIKEELFHLQGGLLGKQVAELQAQRPGTEDLYFVGVAPYALQDTFMRELQVVRKLMDERFDTAGRSLALINHTATLRETPIASVTQLRSALEGVGNLMNPDEDVLFLFVSTHGSKDSHELSFELPPLALQALTPTALGRMLQDGGFKWKVIVISACFSGGFVEPLKDENSLIITSADANHSSFGCDYASDFTWFSKAFFDEGLRRNRSLTLAFEYARDAVAAREKAQGLEPSNPQMFVGSAMREKLESLTKRLDAQ